ncbi:MAG TPA: hypothetical protein VFS00_13505, partial [Polyangiaceae bacterium]|nr:hypothetical protein [Polyangiaceae bacterium]
LEAAAAAFGFVYTRYADDLTLSSPAPAPGATAKMLNVLRAVVASEGFVLHPQKTRLLRRGRRQEVTGLTVNRGLAVERAELRRFRALLHQLDAKGPAGLHWKQSGDVFASALGFANYVAMVQPEKGAALRARVRELMAKHGYRPPPRPARPAPAASPGAPAAPPGSPAVASGSPAAAPAGSPATGAAPPGNDPPKPGDGPGPGDGPAKKKWWKLF